MWNEIKTALRITALLTVVTGLIYPAAMTGLCQLLFPRQANGSLLRRDGHVVGSEWIGQPFESADYFHPRPSAAGSGYDATQSGGSNLGPTNQALVDRVRKAALEFRAENPGYTGAIPADALTASGSGLDPDISPANALAQASRVAQTRGAATDQVTALVQSFVQRRQWGFLGEPRVNVLELNLALDRQFPRRPNPQP